MGGVTPSHFFLFIYRTLIRACYDLTISNGVSIMTLKIIILEASKGLFILGTMYGIGIILPIIFK